jgi:thiamine-phosphate pyrophosphorylase
VKAFSGLYAITPDLEETSELARRVALAIGGGATAVQYRNKTAPAALRFEQVWTLRQLCRHHGVPLIVNDHVALALEADADGVHLGATDGGIDEAKLRLGPHKIVGASCYDSIAQASRAVAQGADYLAFGSFFASRSKPAAVSASLQLLTDAKRRFSVPIVAIGGITSSNARLVIDAGADAIAVISAVFSARDIRAEALGLSSLFRHATHDWQRTAL